MPLEPAAELLAYARCHWFAVGYFESWDVASLEGTIDAAEATRSPIVVGFNGEFLARSERDPPARLEWYGALARAAAETARVPCAAIFNECPWDDWVERATLAGFNLVMPTDPEASYANLADRVARLVHLAHARGVAVEAELGELPAGTAGHGHEAGSPTDPDQAADFVQRTGIDVLAVSVGNVHVVLEGQRWLDLGQVGQIAAKVEIPLALHGGSGIEPQSLRQAIALGVAKVNYGTYLKQRCLTAWQRALAAGWSDPHRALGDGREDDLMVIERRAVREAVLERLPLLGCGGRA